jgi:hypothetical protein
VVVNCVLFVRNARRGGAERGGNGLGNDLRNFEILFAQYYGFLVYFECVFAMLFSNVGESEKPGFLLLLAQSCNGSSPTKDAGLVSAFVAP